MWNEIVLNNNNNNNKKQKHIYQIKNNFITGAVY